MQIADTFAMYSFDDFNILISTSFSNHKVKPPDIYFMNPSSIFNHILIA